jgi:protein-S-isoprenylcysteine O-methyltransferase Ste14
MTKLLAGVIGVLTMTLAGALSFGCAGRWDLPMFWVYIGFLTVVIVGGMSVLDPSLVKERIHPGPGGKDYVGTTVLGLLWFGQFAVAGLDVGRYHWSDTVPLAVQVIGLLAVAATVVVQGWAMTVNRFFSSVLRIQTDRGHQVVTAGPYRFVRHPAYATAPFFLAGGGLALGSWLAALSGLVMIFPLLIRTAREDRMLRDQLAGYADYAQRVRYRLFPGVW